MHFCPQELFALLAVAPFVVAAVRALGARLRRPR